MSAVEHRCLDRRVIIGALDWSRLPLDGIQHDDHPEIPGGSCLELRTCPPCHSTLSTRHECETHRHS